MSNVQINSVQDSLNAPEFARAAVTTLTRAEAMGLLPENETIDRLDLATLQKVAQASARAGIGHGLAADLTTAHRPDPKRLSVALQKLNEALAESPVPSRAWPRSDEDLGSRATSPPGGISPASARRYLSRSRSTPDDIAARLHFLALVVGDLAGAYNDIGIRRWFERQRTLLGNRSPLANAIHYIHHNPVKAGLVGLPERMAL